MIQDSTDLLDWERSGEYILYGPLSHKVFVKQMGNSEASSDKTLLLLHGFPESSYSYHAIVEGMLQTFDRIVCFDMIGYGWSDKPVEKYSYSLLEQADVAFKVWEHFGIKGGHLLSHDMGVSVATEILFRQELKLIPAWFSEGLQSVTFTNGSMILAMSKLRITQKILRSNYGHLLAHFMSFKLFDQQVRSAHGNNNLSEKSIQELWDSNMIQDGQLKTHLTIKYLNDRQQFEKTRWLPALSQTKLPIHLCWGNEDNVAKVEMAHYLKEQVCTNATLTIMDGLGHFCQLGSPQKWIQYTSQFYKDLATKA